MKLNSPKNTITARSAYEDSYNDDELKGESQHLFYQEKDEDEEKKYLERLVKRREEEAS